MNVDWVSGAAMALRREVWNDAGPLRENYRFYAQDIDFCARARSSGWSVRIVEDAHAIHQIGGTIRRVRNTSALDHDPGLLWLDLLDWARAHHGRIWASSARLAMGVAAAARIAGRSIRALTLRGDARRQARLVTAQYAAALRQLLVEPQQTRSDRTR